MRKVNAATSRANFKYASELKKKGFPTAVHALPQNAIDYVNELLSKGWKGQRISNEINKRYPNEIKASGLKPISRQSFEVYREKYWKKTPALSNLILQGDEKTAKEIEDVMKGYDPFGDLVSYAKSAKKRYEQARSVEKKKKHTSQNAREDLKTGIFAAETVLSKAIDLGIRKRAPIEIGGSVKLEIGEPVNEQDEQELLKEIVKSNHALAETGVYARPKFTGDNMSKQSSPSH